MFVYRLACCLLGLVLLMLWTTACSEDEVTEYLTRSDSQQVGEPWREAASGGGSTAQKPRWDVPTGWEPINSGESSRVATFAAALKSANEDADEASADPEPIEVAVTQFPGDVGGIHANVNRWRGQVGLEPVDSDAIDEIVELFDTPGFEGYAVRLDGPQGTILAAGLFDPLLNRTWFARATASREDVDGIYDDFRRFVRSFAKGSAAQPAMRESTEPYSPPEERQSNDPGDGSPPSAPASPGGGY